MYQLHKFAIVLVLMDIDANILFECYSKLELNDILIIKKI